MALLSNLCNICYKTDNGSFKNISEENMMHLSDTLVTLVGHADIIKYSVIYLCQLCCEELTRFDKFREMCLSNLIQLRQRYINMKLELQADDDACAVQNTLQQFVYEEVVPKSALEKSICPVSMSMDCHEIIKIPVDVNNGCLVFNTQVTNLQLETNEYDMNGAGSEVSDINSVPECEPRLVVTNEEDIKNKMLTHSENTKLEQFEAESDEDVDVSLANNDNNSDNSQIEFVKEEFVLKNERENIYSENFALKNDENESDEHDVKIPVVNNSEGSVNSKIESVKEEFHMKQENSSELLKLETIEDEFGLGMNVAFEVANVRTIVHMEERGHRNIRSEDAQLGTKLRNRRSKNKSTASTINRHPSRLHVREDCNGRSPTALHSATHKRAHPDAKPNTCVVCKKSFRTRSLLVRHERIHSLDRPYKCLVCNKAFARPYALTTHNRIHSGDRPFKCPVCNKAFTRSSTLKTHKRIHSGDKPFKCSVCSKAFAQSSALTTHKRMHSGDRPFKCPVCNKVFVNSSNLTRHKLIHSGDKPYKCPVCNKAFALSFDLTRHKRIHSGDRPFKCPVCNKAFAQSATLTTHKRTHSGDRSFKCPVCNKAFAQSAALTTHKRIHSGDRPFKCPVCNKAFTRSSTLKTHKRIHSGDRPYKCSV